MDFFTRTKHILSGTSPAFWDQVRKERGLGDPFRYFLGLFGIFAAVLLLIAVGGMVMSGEGIERFAIMIPGLELSPYVGLAVIGALFFFAMFVGMYVGAMIQHLFIRMFKGTGDFAHTYRALVYASAPNMIFGSIPFIGWIAGIFSFYLQIRGFSELHGFTMGKAFGVMILTVVVSMVAAMAIAFGLIMIFASMPGFQFS